jgi:hypothetical protein
MNLKTKTQEIKTLVRELEISEKVLKQSLAVITSRKEKLKMELVGMGATNSTSRGKYETVLSDKQRQELIGNLI